MKRTVALIILDGYGIGRPDNTNPIHAARPAMMNYFKKNFLSGALEASGISVGLPWNEEGNSEVGHITLGAGQIIYQHYPRISLTVRNENFFKNKKLKKVFETARASGGGAHLIGALSSGNVHASLEHLEALLEMARREKIDQVYLHLITDGRDSPPKSALDLIKKIEGVMKEKGVGAIASLAGRYYAMDRDDHYDRTELAYHAIIGENPTEISPADWITRNYAEGLTDEYIKPVNLNPQSHVKDGDALIFFNFREDSIRQLAKSFIAKHFDRFATVRFANLSAVTFTHYGPGLDAAVAFPVEEVRNPLGKVIADAGLIQLRIAETEKYAHVTYFFNDLHEAAFPNEYRILIPSQNLARHDEHPEMRAREIADRIIQAFSEGGSDFILANFANPDVIAHTGNFEAAIAAINAVDAELRRIYEAAAKLGAVLVITSDHGNIEVMADPLTGRVETKHNTGPVPIHIVGQGFVSLKSARDLAEIENTTAGVLSDVAPTILKIMSLPVPAEMTGVSLLKRLR